MSRTASLGMYDTPALRAANAALWSLIAERLTQRGVPDVPAALDRDRPLDATWNDSDLLFAQCCGYPLVTRYQRQLRYLTTPRYTAPGCSGSSYRSRIVVRTDDARDGLARQRGRTAAVNQWHSNSGMNVFRAVVAPLSDGAPFFAAVVETGSHAASLSAVAEGVADVAAIDAVSFAHMARDHPAIAAGVRTIGWTEATPGLPFVTARTTPEPIVRLLLEAVEDAVRDAGSLPACAPLLLDGTERLAGGEYDRVLELERDAVRLGYPVLA